MCGREGGSGGEHEREREREREGGREREREGGRERGLMLLWVWEKKKGEVLINRGAREKESVREGNGC